MPLEAHRPESIVVVGLARNCEASLPSLLALFSDLSDHVSAARFVFVENGSTDTTRTLLDHWSGGRTDSVVLSPDEDVEQLARPSRIAACRNLAIDYIRAHCAQSHYLIVIDMDLPCGKLDPAAIVGAIRFLQDQAGCAGVFANSNPVYYDIWALRHPFWCPEDCWKEARTQSSWPFLIAQAVFVQSRQLRIEEHRAPIEVTSAFNGLAIYRLADVIDGHYVGADAEGLPTCEHVAFNRVVIDAGKRLFILPRLTVSAPPEHINPIFRRIVPGDSLMADVFGL